MYLLEYVSENDLGVLFDEKLTFREHQIINKAYIQCLEW